MWQIFGQQATTFVAQPFLGSGLPEGTGRRRFLCEVDSNQVNGVNGMSPKDHEVNPEMLVLARYSRGHTQKALSGISGMSQALLARYEAGSRMVSCAHLAVLARVLDYPEGFFTPEAILDIGLLRLRRKLEQDFPLRSDVDLGLGMDDLFR